MKQPIKNIISMVLLVFYLAGFCGIHLLKHSCSSCDHSSIQIAQNENPETNHQNCTCGEHDHSKDNSQTKIDDKQNSICCDYELIYLKNSPTTILTKQNKAPLANENILFIQPSFNFLAIQTETNLTENTKFYLLKHSGTDLDLLCTYLC